VRTPEELRDAMLGWLAAAASLPTSQVRPTFCWLCEVRGCSFDAPTRECLAGVLDSLAVMALAGGSSRPALESQIAPFRDALAEI